MSPSKERAFVPVFKFCQNCKADLIIAIPIYLFASSFIIQLTAIANLIEVSHLSRVDEMSGLQIKSKYIPKGFIPYGLKLFIGEFVSCFIATKTEAITLAVDVQECLGLINLIE